MIGGERTLQEGVLGKGATRGISGIPAVPEVTRKEIGAPAIGPLTPRQERLEGPATPGRAEVPARAPDFLGLKGLGLLQRGQAAGTGGAGAAGREATSKRFAITLMKNAIESFITDPSATIPAHLDALESAQLPGVTPKVIAGLRDAYKDIRSISTDVLNSKIGGVRILDMKSDARMDAILQNKKTIIRFFTKNGRGREILRYYSSLEGRGLRETLE